jgi:hypothetical protein
LADSVHIVIIDDQTNRIGKLASMSVDNFITDIESFTSHTTAKFVLKQNYPNPFNPVTKINYSVPKMSFIKINVYDILGNEITTLVNEEKSAGDYAVEFNGSNLSSGIYFYRMQTGTFIDIKKFILMK